MRRREHALQVAVAHMLQIVLDPERTWWTSIDHGVGRLGPAEAGIRKARGVKPGVPDIIVMFGFTNMIGIELKIAGGRSSVPQIEVAAAWHRLGHPVFIARSLEEVQSILIDCHVPMRTRMTFFSGGGHERHHRSAAPRHKRTSGRRKSKNRLPVVQPHASQEN